MLSDRELQRAIDNFAGRMRPPQGVARQRTRTLLAQLGDGVTAMAATDAAQWVTVPWDMVVIEWRILTNPVGSLAIDVALAAWTDFPTFVSMVGGAYPATVTGTQSGFGDTSLWETTLIREGDILAISVHTVSAAMTTGLVQLKCMEAAQ